MLEIRILAINLAKKSFQVCGVRSDGVAVFNGALSRTRFVQLLSDQSPELCPKVGDGVIKRLCFRA